MLDIIKYLDDSFLVMKDHNIGPATPVIMRERVPYMNGEYDFSRITGDYTYGNRPVSLTYTCMSNIRDHMQNIYTNIITKLLSTSEIMIKMPGIRGYLKGTVESYSSLESFVYAGVFSINLSCYPFKVDDVEYGNTLWDDFCFDIDYLEPKTYLIEGTKTININNIGRTIVPVIQSDAVMKIKLNDYTTNLIIGENKDRKIKLLNGLNTLEVVGTGTIIFKFTQEFM
jgi:phage-related protein